MATEWKALRNGVETAEKDYETFIEENEVNEKRRIMNDKLEDIQVTLEELIGQRERLERDHIASTTPVQDNPRIRLRPTRTTTRQKGRLITTKGIGRPDGFRFLAFTFNSVL
ncbi:unnamed protein product [Bursaphelenchus okinawaensis]|uniref:Uncharacterized protein n=1 Tax=Bursaphelenchus okinawaensis TaxID=465554 RepID=A0A811K7H7_9BILA|nr:unnamed protein product [Bursaphelenchus okinawaensis]CAG9094928.1 unnamed protein product [Bursaphelenchus okinawaensis]